MNKVILMGRLTKEPEVRYSQSAEPLAIARYTLAVSRRFKRQGEQNTDFIPCVALGKNGEFAERYLDRGQMISVVGRLQVRNWEDNNGNKRITTEVVVDEQYFAESRKSGRMLNEAAKETRESKGDVFYPIDDNIQDDDLPF